ncbi:glycerophosphodiester phosphodiesterase [Candidatus Bathyarchaeota archaeon]|nr:glycerophosphodiester phosphodiesterase [Candidatus Bathyarchaeota archaeon]
MIKVTGHRGASGLEPENTLRSIRKAIELGVDQVEVDVHLTRDCEIVVIHDDKVDRTTDGHGYVREFTFEELRKLDAGKGERIPTLREVLNLTVGRVILQIELKGEGTADPVVRLIEEIGAENWVIITSFHPEMLKRVRELDPAISTGLLIFKPENDPCRKALEVGAKALHVNFRHVDRELIEAAHQRGLKVCVWNPDTEEDMVRMVELGVDAIGSNRPDILVNLLKKIRLELLSGKNPEFKPLRH